MKGTVKFFDEKKGWGFVSPEGGGKELFVHYSNITGDGFKTLAENDKIEFDVIPSDRGPRAGNVRRA